MSFSKLKKTLKPNMAKNSDQTQKNTKSQNAQEHEEGRESLVHFENVTKRHPNEAVALEGVNFSVAPGELVSVVGLSLIHI